MIDFPIKWCVYLIVIMFSFHGDIYHYYVFDEILLQIHAMDCEYIHVTYKPGFLPP